MRRWLVPFATVTAIACGDAAKAPDYDRTGAIEVILAFRSTSQPGTFTAPDPADVRRVIAGLALRDITIERLQYRVDDAMRPALRVMVAFDEWPTPARREEATAAIDQQYGQVLTKVAWSGSRLFMRSTAPLEEAPLRAILGRLEIVVVEPIRAEVDHEIREHQTVVTVGFTDVRIERALEAHLPDTDVVLASSLMVGPRRHGPGR